MYSSSTRVSRFSIRQKFVGPKIREFCAFFVRFWRICAKNTLIRNSLQLTIRRCYAFFNLEFANCESLEENDLIGRLGSISGFQRQYRVILQSNQVIG